MNTKETSMVTTPDVTADVDPQIAPIESNINGLPTLEKLDIEHVAVHDDPRKWSNARKTIVLLFISYASMMGGLASNVQNPAIQDMERELPATAAQFSLSISLFTLMQGNIPLLWSAISEIKGRKTVYLISIAIFTIASIVVATSKTMGLVIGFRVLQGVGSSAVMGVGAATLADIFEPHERGTKMGIYYIAPLLGPSLGPIFGGVLTTGFNWRASFWFLTIIGGISWISFIFFKDTFRKERSLIYQNAWKSRMQEQATDISKRSSNLTVTQPSNESSDASVSESNEKKEVEIAVTDMDVEAQSEIGKPVVPVIKLSLRDVNPFRPLWLIVRRVNNVVMFFATSIYFAFGFVIVYSTSRTLGSAYGYNALKIGLVLLSFGLGSVGGSLLGGRWSDRVLTRLKAKNGGKGYPEMRLKSTVIGQILLPPCVLAYAWIIQQRVHVSAVCVFLFLCGFFSIRYSGVLTDLIRWIYSSTLAYIVDANVGRSSSAVAANSSFRGTTGFIMTEVAVPLQDAIGDGWMYTLWAGLMVIAGLLVLLVLLKGERWRHAVNRREERATQKEER